MYLHTIEQKKKKIEEKYFMDGSIGQNGADVCVVKA